MKKLIKKLDSTGGWKARQDIEYLLENCRMDFSAAQGCFEGRNWDEMLLNIEDGFKNVQMLKKIVRSGGEIRVVDRPYEKSISI